MEQWWEADMPVNKKADAMWDAMVASSEMMAYSGPSWSDMFDHIVLFVDYGCGRRDGLPYDQSLDLILSAIRERLLQVYGEHGQVHP